MIIYIFNVGISFLFPHCPTTLHIVVTSLVNTSIAYIFNMLKKILAVIGALIGGGLGIAVVSAAPAVQAGVTMN